MDSAMMTNHIRLYLQSYGVEVTLKEITVQSLPKDIRQLNIPIAGGQNIQAAADYSLSKPVKSLSLNNEQPFIQAERWLQVPHTAIPTRVTTKQSIGGTDSSGRLPGRKRPSLHHLTSLGSGNQSKVQ